MLKIKNTISFAALLCGLLIVLAASKEASAQTVKAVSIYRLLVANRHIYTTDKNEKDSIVKLGWKEESSPGFVLPKQVPGTVPLYRLQLNKDVSKNFYTISEQGKKGAMQKYGYRDNGILGYVSPVKTDNTMPLFRMYRAATKPPQSTTLEKILGAGDPFYVDSDYYDDHFYTTSESEKGSANGSYSYEGIEGYIWTTQIAYGMDGKQAITIAGQDDNKPIVIGKGNPNGEIGNKKGRPPIVITKNSPQETLERAFRDVYGYPPDAQRTAYWTARNADYDTIVAEESKRQNAEPIARKLMISRVYKDTFGRVADEKDMGYWLPRAEYYKQIFDGNREFLYSPGGSTHLVETVKRALTAKNGKTPTDGEITEAIKIYRKTKAIYDEMN